MKNVGPTQRSLDYRRPDGRGDWLSRKADDMELRPWELVGLITAVVLFIVAFVTFPLFFNLD
ncbi:MAG: hypothetical protein ACAI43_08510 [Phycisphaerae bacterium]|nr:hypothetical protein [Tepidisphaeraceae bacterium]